MLNASTTDFLICQCPGNHPLLAHLHLLHPLLNGILKQQKAFEVSVAWDSAGKYLKRLVNIIVNYLHNEPSHLDCSLLPNAVNSHDSLLFHCGVPPWILHKQIAASDCQCDLLVMSRLKIIVISLD